MHGPPTRLRAGAETGGAGSSLRMRWYPDTVTCILGGDGQCRKSIKGDVHAGRRPERSSHEPPGVDEAHEVAVLVDSVLVAHRTAGARGRRPVDLPHVVVRRVVTDRLELRADPEPRADPPGLGEPAACPGLRHPPCAGQVRHDDDVDRLARSRGRSSQAREGLPRERSCRGIECTPRWRPTRTLPGRLVDSWGASESSGGTGWRRRSEP